MLYIARTAVLYVLQRFMLAWVLAYILVGATGCSYNNKHLSPGPFDLPHHLNCFVARNLSLTSNLLLLEGV